MGIREFCGPHRGRRSLRSAEPGQIARKLLFFEINSRQWVILSVAVAFGVGLDRL